jgi:hypothetical protein
VRMMMISPVLLVWSALALSLLSSPLQRRRF